MGKHKLQANHRSRLLPCKYDTTGPPMVDFVIADVWLKLLVYDYHEDCLQKITVALLQLNLPQAKAFCNLHCMPFPIQSKYPTVQYKAPKKHQYDKRINECRTQNRPLAALQQQKFLEFVEKQYHPYSILLVARGLIHPISFPCRIAVGVVTAFYFTKSIHAKNKNQTNHYDQIGRNQSTTNNSRVIL